MGREHQTATGMTDYSPLQRLAIAPDQWQRAGGAADSPTQIGLTAAQIHYLRRVLRLSSGDQFIALDGQGQWWLAELATESEAIAEIHHVIPVQTELPIPLTLVMALPKGNGFDEVVRQVTELGVTTIVPVISDRTLLQPSPQKLDRWRRIIQEAAEQSERQIIPTLADPIPFTQHLASLAADPPAQQARYFCATRGQFPALLSRLDSTHPLPSEILIAIGPEGGWTEREQTAAIAAHYQPISLGRRILRSVTAPVAAIAIVAAVVDASSAHPDGSA